MALPPFIDSVHAAEVLHVSHDALLDLITAGDLKPFAGPPSKPFLRSDDVLALAAALGATAGDEPAKRVKSATARVQARISADARWRELQDDDLQEWARRADRDRRAAGRTVAIDAMARLQALLRALDEVEGRG